MVLTADLNILVLVDQMDLAIPDQMELPVVQENCLDRSDNH